jgi:phage-related protein
MALNTFTPPVAPSPGYSADFKPKLWKADFGDGYTQSTRQGLNHIGRQVPIKWDTLTVAQAQAIEDFFIAQGGDTAFLYALSNDITRQWRCEEWHRTRDGAQSITATFLEDFNIWS